MQTETSNESICNISCVRKCLHRIPKHYNYQFVQPYFQHGHSYICSLPICSQRCTSYMYTHKHFTVLSVLATCQLLPQQTISFSEITDMEIIQLDNYASQIKDQRHHSLSDFGVQVCCCPRVTAFLSATVTWYDEPLALPGMKLWVQVTSVQSFELRTLSITARPLSFSNVPVFLILIHRGI